MGFIKMLIGLPLLIVILVFAFVNNDLATFNLWPFYIEITVSLSVAIVFFLLVGFFLGNFFSWLSYMPLRKALKNQKKEVKKLSKEQEKLVKEVGSLQENIKVLKEYEPKPVKPSFKSRLKNLFKRKKEENTQEPESFLLQNK